MMVLSEDNYIEVIDSFSVSDWDPLFQLIPEIEKTQKFGEEAGMEEVEKGVFTFPYWEPSVVVLEFHEIVYKMPIIITFEWSKWDEGRKIANDDSFDFDTIDIPTKCKLITAIVRNDRFCDGVLIQAFECGLMLRIIKSIKKQVESKFGI